MPFPNVSAQLILTCLFSSPSFFGTPSWSLQYPTGVSKKSTSAPNICHLPTSPNISFLSPSQVTQVMREKVGHGSPISSGLFGCCCAKTSSPSHSLHPAVPSWPGEDRLGKPQGSQRLVHGHHCLVKTKESEESVFFVCFLLFWFLDKVLHCNSWDDEHLQAWWLVFLRQQGLGTFQFPGVKHLRTRHTMSPPNIQTSRRKAIHLGPRSLGSFLVSQKHQPARLARL